MGNIELIRGTGNPDVVIADGEENQSVMSEEPKIDDAATANSGGRAPRNIL